MGRLARAELDREWSRSRELLGELLGEPPRTASVPGGYLLARWSSRRPRPATSCCSPPSRRRARARGARGARPLHDLGHDARARWPSAYARGQPLACGRLWLEWNAKKLAKRASPAAYQALRRVRAARAEAHAGRIPGAAPRAREAPPRAAGALLRMPRRGSRRAARRRPRASPRARARSPSRSASRAGPRRSAIRSSSRAAAPASPGATSSAAPSAAAATPPTAVATAGRPLANASTSTCGNPSVHDTCRKAWLDR